MNSRDNVKDSLFHVRNYKKKSICVLVLLLILISWLGIIDKKTEYYIDQAMVNAVVAFGAARGINAAVSVIKSTEVSAMFVSAGIGKVLDPVDDMVEDFSTIMKISLASLASQKIIIEIVSSNFFKILLTIGGLLFIATLLFGPQGLTNIFFKIFLTAGMLRFLLIVILAGSTFADSAFLKERTEAEIQKVQQQEEEFQAARKKTKLSEEKQAELKEKLTKQLEQRKDIRHQIENADQSLQESQKKLSAAEERLKEASKGRLTLDSLNFMKEEDPQYKSAKKAQEASAEEVEKWSERLEELNERLEEKNESIKEIKAVLAGRDEGSFLGEMKRKISGIKEALSLENIKQTAQNFMETSIRLIALFVIKTIVLPLVFLYIGIKGFEKIWKINLPEFIREKKTEGKEMLAKMQGDKTGEHA